MVMKKLLFLAIGAAAFSVILLHHRGHVGDVQSVHDVLAYAPELIGRDITVSGVAGNNLALLGVGGFEIKGADGSTLTVVSSEGVPLAGSQVTIHGVLRQAFASGTLEKLVLVEEPVESKEPQPAR
jgi:hypothetical protein